MDSPTVSKSRLAAALRFIRRVNAVFGYTRTTLSHLERLTRNWPAGRVLRVLDVATGSADVPVAVARWAKRRGIAVMCVGIDLHQSTLDYATQNTSTIIPLVRGDALRLPFGDGAFDIVMTSMFTHHLPDNLVVAVLREMDRAATHGIILADLLRNKRAYGWITLFTMFSDPMVRHDARVSVKQAFTIAEITELLQDADINYAHARQHFGYRFVVSGLKSGTPMATNPSAV